MAEQTPPASDPVEPTAAAPPVEAPIATPVAETPAAETPVAETPAAEPSSAAAPPTEAPPVEAVAAASDPAAANEPPPADPLPDQASIDQLLQAASFEDPATASAAAAIPETEPFKLPNFQQVMQDAQVSSIDLLRDVELDVKIELGRSRMLVEDVLKLGEGSVVELDKLAGDPVDVFVNDRLIARGEVLVLNDNFCVRVNEIVAGAKEEGL